MLKIYPVYFLIYAMAGWLLEVAFNGIKNKKYINCGVLNGPWCPMYGLAAILIIISLDFFRINNKIALFFISMFVASIVEFITGFILEKLFGKKWWDYSDRNFNLLGYICLEYSLMFAAVGFIFYDAIHPSISHLVGKIPENFLIITNIIIGIAFVIDTTATINSILGINKKFAQIEKSSEKIGELTDELGEKIAEKTIEKAEKLTEGKKEIDEKKLEIREIFDKYGERRLLKAFPNLIKDLEDKRKARKD